MYAVRPQRAIGSGALWNKQGRTKGESRTRKTEQEREEGARGEREHADDSLGFALGPGYADSGGESHALRAGSVLDTA